MRGLFVPSLAAGMARGAPWRLCGFYELGDISNNCRDSLNCRHDSFDNCRGCFSSFWDGQKKSWQAVACWLLDVLPIILTKEHVLECDYGLRKMFVKVCMVAQECGVSLRELGI